MQYVLVNKYDEIVTSVELAGDVGVNGATTYFQGIKQMPDRKAFLKLWKVLFETLLAEILPLFEPSINFPHQR